VQVSLAVSPAKGVPLNLLGPYTWPGCGSTLTCSFVGWSRGYLAGSEGMYAYSGDSNPWSTVDFSLDPYHGVGTGSSFWASLGSDVPECRSGDSVLASALQAAAPTPFVVHVWGTVSWNSGGPRTVSPGGIAVDAPDPERTLGRPLQGP
jgi:hypothetical protein